ncbi:mycofactocin biosynthesis peptidyl-dipeptidase MftE [Agromyces tropicus]|uniref:Mycofactocin biosynthesis peptidyl-dipeptidase MftE n=1 Tax=Agromyces tropicus TaxID=555371 RepID=A0ABP5FK84_9MICO
MPVRTAATDPVEGEGAQRPRALVDRPWPIVGRPVLFIPVGSTEQHGPHLPLDTDTVIAAAVAEELAERRRAVGEDAVVAPAVGFGASGEHQAFPGTISIGTAALEAVVIELCRSATTWVDRIVFVNGHGGNVPALTAAVSRVRVEEDRDAAWLSCVPREGIDETDTHAGRLETSVMLHLEPMRVHESAIERGVTEPLPDLMPSLRADGVSAVSPNGVLGDPTHATAADGARIFESICDRAWHLVRGGHVDSAGRLMGARPA